MGRLIDRGSQVVNQQVTWWIQSTVECGEWKWCDVTTKFAGMCWLSTYQDQFCLSHNRRKRDRRNFHASGLGRRTWVHFRTIWASQSHSRKRNICHRTCGAWSNRRSRDTGSFGPRPPLKRLRWPQLGALPQWRPPCSSRQSPGRFGADVRAIGIGGRGRRATGGPVGWPAPAAAWTWGRASFRGGWAGRGRVRRRPAAELNSAAAAGLCSSVAVSPMTDFGLHSRPQSGSRASWPAAGGRAGRRLAAADSAGNFVENWRASSARAEVSTNPMTGCWATGAQWPPRPALVAWADWPLAPPSCSAVAGRPPPAGTGRSTGGRPGWAGARRTSRRRRNWKLIGRRGARAGAGLRAGLPAAAGQGLGRWPMWKRPSLGPAAGNWIGARIFGRGLSDYGHWFHFHLKVEFGFYSH